MDQTSENNGQMQSYLGDVAVMLPKCHRVTTMSWICHNTAHVLQHLSSQSLFRAQSRVVMVCLAEKKQKAAPSAHGV